MTFFMIRPERKKGEITILSRTQYDRLRLLEIVDFEERISSFSIDEGKILFDIIRFADSRNFAISEKFRNLLVDNQIIGWRYFPINIETIKEKFYCVVATSTAGPILNLEAVNNYETENREFDIRTWDGSDIFILKDTMIFVVTAKVKSIIQNAGITNVYISPL